MYKAQEKICREIQAIMETYREQMNTKGYIDTPGGLEHMGDVWRTLERWGSELLEDETPKADGLDTLKREEMFHQFMDVLDETNIPNLYAVMAASTLADRLAQRGMLLPDGWVAVPREPNVDMVDAAVNHALAIKLGGSETWRTYMTSLYKAMIAAAPYLNTDGRE